MNGGIINSVTRLHLCRLFLLSHTAMHGSMNIKLKKSIYSVYTKINYEIVCVTNWNKYLQYGTIGTE